MAQHREIPKCTPTNLPLGGTFQTHKKSQTTGVNFKYNLTRAFMSLLNWGCDVKLIWVRIMRFI